MPRKDPLFELTETHLQAQRLLNFHLTEHVGKGCGKDCKILSALLEVIQSLPGPDSLKEKR